MCQVPPLDVTWGKKHRKPIGLAAMAEPKLETGAGSGVTSDLQEITQSVSLFIEIIIEQQKQKQQIVVLSSLHAYEDRVPLSEFTKLKPPQFEGKDDEDSYLFVDERDKRCRALYCSFQRAMQMAEFRLIGTTKH